VTESTVSLNMGQSEYYSLCSQCDIVHGKRFSLVILPPLKIQTIKCIFSLAFNIKCFFIFYFEWLGFH